MGKTALLLVFVGLFVPSPVSGITLQQSPIHSTLQQNLLAAGSSHSSNFQEVNFSENSDNLKWESPRGGRKSVAKAALYSALLPGWGEYYVGHKKKARFFFTFEAVSWMGFIGFTTYGNWKKDDFIRFGGERAGARLNGKSDWFLDMVGFYNDIDEYNSFGRIFDPDRPYLKDNTANHWRWQDSREREIYRHLKNRSREAHRRAQFMIGLAILNRVVSVIDAVRDARRSKRALGGSFGNSSKVGYRIDVNPFHSRRQVGFTLFARF